MGDSFDEVSGSNHGPEMLNAIPDLPEPSTHSLGQVVPEMSGPTAPEPTKADVLKGKEFDVSEREGGEPGCHLASCALSHLAVGPSHPPMSPPPHSPITRPALEQFFELDTTWLDRLDVGLGLDFSDILDAPNDVPGPADDGERPALSADQCA